MCDPVKVGIRCALHDATGSGSMCHVSWSVKAGSVFRGPSSALEFCLLRVRNDKIGLHIRFRLVLMRDAPREPVREGGGTRPIGLRPCQLCAPAQYTGRLPGMCGIMPGDRVGSFTPPFSQVWVPPHWRLCLCRAV